MPFLALLTSCSEVSELIEPAPDPTVAFSVERLGALPGDSCSVAVGVNDQGHVVGWSYSDSGLLVRPFLWTPEDGMRELETPQGMGAAATRINNKGEIAGHVIWPEPSGVLRWKVVRWESPDASPVALQFHGLEDHLTQAFAINETGDVLVHVHQPDSAGVARPPLSVIWGPEESRLLDNPGCRAFYAVDLNDRGELAVSMDGCDPAQPSSVVSRGAAVVRGTEMRVLHSKAEPYSLNNHGDVSGAQWSDSEGGYQTGYWDGVGAWHQSEARIGRLAINDHRDFAGTVWRDMERREVLLLRDGVVHRLENPHGSSTFIAMNNAGHLVGSSHVPFTTCRKAVRWYVGLP